MPDRRFTAFPAGTPVSPPEAAPRHLLCLALGIGMLLATLATPSSSPGSEEASMTRLLDRLNQIEEENRKLQSRVQQLESSRISVEIAESVDTLFQESPDSEIAPPPEEFPGEAPGTASLTDHQEQRLFSLERAFQDFAHHSVRPKYPTAALTGVFQADAGWFKQDAGSLNDYGPISNGVDFRRFRLAAKGEITPHTRYFAQVDFGFLGRPTVQDLYVDQTDVPVLGTVRIGQWKQPFSLEVVSSFRYTTFMERSVLFIPFTPFRHLGIGFYDVNDEQDMTWAASFFAAGNDQYGGSISLSGGYGSAERVTFLPHWNDDGREYLHLGFGHYFSAPNNHIAHFRTQPEAFVGANPADPGSSGSGVSGKLNGTPPFVSTGNIHVDAFNVIGTELLWVNGRFSLQSEAMVNFVSTRDQAANAVFMATNDGTAVLPGAYAQIGYFLTDDYRPYDRKAGAIDRVIPRNSFGFCDDCSPRGGGAWEVAARFSYLNLNDQAGTGVRGGQIADYTLGVNWYTTPYTKLVFNYIRSVSDPGVITSPIIGNERANTEIFMTRFQADF